MTNKELLTQGALALGISLREDQVAQFLTYLAELLRWNKKLNLTAITKAEDIIVKHFLDSLTILPVLRWAKAASLLDVGSGAGFPGIPIKIVAPYLAVTLLEATRKKVSFERHIIRELGLTGIEARQGRLEALAPEDVFAAIVSRALGKTARFLKLTTPHLAEGGLIICMKGRRAEAELAEATPLLPGLGLTLLQEQALRLPPTDEPRHLYLFRKA